MFLFTNAPVGNRDTGSAAVASSARAGASQSGTGQVGTGIVDAIREGAERSGVGFEYMLATAKRESALNPTAKAASSSATGLYQFIEQTWLGTMKSAGSKLGLSNYADAITARSDGSFGVSDPSARQAILDLRRDPRVSAAMAGELTQRNRDTLASALGREPSNGELYAAHVLGAKGAASLIATATTSPDRAAALDMPDAASANRGLFYDRTGRPRSSSDLYATLTAATAQGAPSTAIGSGGSDVPTSYASLDHSLRSLFQTDRRQGAVSESVARLWQDRAGAAANRSAPSYFPRSDASERSGDTAEADPMTADQATKAVPQLVPLPPQRPSGLAAGAGRTGPAALIEPSTFKLRSGT